MQKEGRIRGTEIRKYSMGSGKDNRLSIATVWDVCGCIIKRRTNMYWVSLCEAPNSAFHRHYTMALKMSSPGKLLELQEPYPDTLNHKLWDCWEWGPAICVLTHLQDDSDAY